METQILDVIKIWAGVAWADGTLAAPEAAILKQLIATAQLPEDQEQQALGFLKTKVELGDVDVGALSEDARKGVYRAACRLATVDDDIASAERTFLERLRGVLQLADDVARQIEYSVPGI